VITIREATEADIFRLIEMTTRFLCSTRYGEWMKPTPEQIDAFVVNVMKLGVVLVAEASVPEEQRLYLVGMIGIVLLPYPLTGELHADEIAWWVEPEYRNVTVGPKLLWSAERWATTNGAKVCKMVAPSGTDIGTFYARHDYVEVETIFVKRF
jgi:GNAT superfamily N-acetyltransferase